MYDTSGVGDSFRRSTIVLLGSWHIYKMATTCVWRLAGPDFIGPLFHQMFPTSKYPTNPRLVLATRILSLIRLAYPSFKPEVESALGREAKSRFEKAHLANLRDLCEWFIPKVCYLLVFLLFGRGLRPMVRLFNL